MPRPRKTKTKNILISASRISVYHKTLKSRPNIRTLYIDNRLNGRREYDFDTLAGLELTGNAAHDAEVKRIAENVIRKMALEAAMSRNGLPSPHRQRQDFYVFFERISAKETGKTRDTYAITLKYLKKFRPTLTFGELEGKAGARFFIDFQDFLHKENGLNTSTAKLYLSKLEKVIRKAVQEDYILRNPKEFVDRADLLKTLPPEKKALSSEELRAMAGAHCQNSEVRRAFLFSCLTGLRLSDVEGLTWGDIRDRNVTKTMQKTGKRIEIPLSQSALDLLGKRGNERSKIFSLPSRPTINAALKTWAKEAKIRDAEKLSFHCARHTFATLVLASTDNLKTVADLLGHASVVQSQIYVKGNEAQRKNAVNSLPTL